LAAGKDKSMTRETVVQFVGAVVAIATVLVTVFGVVHML
jgi:hypothetical protein